MSEGIRRLPPKIAAAFLANHGYEVIPPPTPLGSRIDIYGHPCKYYHSHGEDRGTLTDLERFEAAAEAGGDLFPAFLDSLEQMAQLLKDTNWWQDEWVIRRESQYYYAADLRSSLPIRRFKAFDPVTCLS